MSAKPPSAHPSVHAAFIVSTDSQGGEDDEEDRSLLYSYPRDAPAGSTASHINSFKSLSLAIRGVLDSICGEKTKLVHLEHGGTRMLLASAHLESVMLVVALRQLVPPSAATALVLHLAETLVLLMGPFAQWGLIQAKTPGGARPGSAGGPAQTSAETQAILDRVFEGVLTQIDSPQWGPRMAPWTCFESSCLYLALPGRLQQRLAGIVAEHAAQHHKAPFSFFRKHSCLMYRGLLLASDLHPRHAKQLWQLLWTLGVLQHAGGLPCQILTRIVHLPHPSSAGAAAAAGRGPAGGAGGTAAATAAAVAALQHESAGVTVSEQPMGRSLLVVASAMHMVMAVVLTGYDEEIEEELAGRLEGHSAAELLQRLHGALGADLERLVEASGVYSAAARSLDATPAAAGDAAAAGARGGAGGAAGGKGAAAGGGAAGGANLLFRLMMRNRSTPHGVGGKPQLPPPVRPPSSVEVPFGPYSSVPASPDGRLPPGRSSTGHAGPGGGGRLATTPTGGQPHDRSGRGGRTGPGGGGAAAPTLTSSPTYACLPVPAPEGALFLIAHDAPHGCVRFLGDLPAGGGALAAVWRAVAACRLRFGAHNVAIAAPPKHARLTMTLDQIEQLSAVRSQREGGQRLGTADSSPWQYHPELASLAAVHSLTLRLQLPAAEARGAAGAGAGAAAGAEGAAAEPAPTPTGKSWLARVSSSRVGGSAGGASSGTGSGGAASSGGAPPATAGAGAGGTQGVGGAATGTAPVLYLTAALFPDTRELYICHGPDVDETRLVEGLWDSPLGQELWVREDLGVAS
ncbi:hypothetical protein HXX76_001398 [Chlamydomonas incerta]|uniref:CCZ1/INTU/HSP4 first Longin domain-containing protein n=1 Tax=Chlamydomonas incerta TaxID=51695 RepID=A0A836B1M7_CHLIN|nr:hypothetical protein HXX76_001398 [Chlamydomonas incerta]|eukprot:KAG2444654.1 hypothetical protein HXX76_001398 [Chlamydomonas incerta]